MIWLLACAELPDCAEGFVYDERSGACESAPAEEPPPSVLEPLDAPRLLRRMSLDLRGTLPTVAELDAVEADPDALDAQALLDDPAFEERLVLLLGERWHTLVDDVTIQAVSLRLAPQDEYAYERAVGEEPLRLMARVAAEDRPWSEILSTDWTMGTELLAEIWPMELEPGDEDWRVARYTDARPPVGVLATNGLWWRYGTTESNANRGRAAAIARLLACVDYHARPVSLNGVAEELDATNDPACTNCHAGIDPIASSLFGFWWFQRYNVDEISHYHAERELLGEQTLGTPPGWFGTPVDSLAGLAREIEADPRFTRCTAETFAGVLWRREVELGDFQTVDDLDARFRDADLQLDALLVAITDTPVYRAGGLGEAASDADLEREATRRLLVASQMATVIEDLTGFTWTWAGFSLLHNDSDGFRILAGDVDGTYVYGPSSEPTLTWALVAERVAEGGADHAVTTELVEGGERRLFASVTLDDRPGDEAFDAELERLWWRLYAVRPAAEELADLADLWTAVEADEGPAGAWTAVLTAMLRDPAFLTY